MTRIKNISIAVAFFSVVALLVVAITKLAYLLPIEFGVPLGALLYAVLVYGVVEVLERSR